MDTDFEDSAFSALSPDDDFGTSSSVNLQVHVENSWFQLSDNSNLALPWEQGFWRDFFSNDVQTADETSTAFKRPVPVAFTSQHASQEVVVKRLKPHAKIAESWSDIIKNVEEETWQEHKEAIRQCALKRWLEILRHLPRTFSLVSDLHSFKEIGQQLRFLQDLLSNRSPETMLKRANSFQRLVTLAASEGLGFPPKELELYRLLSLERDANAPASRLQSYMEALRFGHHVLGLREINALTVSRICNSVCKKRLTCERKQASPFTVEELRHLHHLLNDRLRDKWDRLMAGMILMTTYSRSRWSDIQHGQRLIRDHDQFGQLAFLEVHSFEFKTRNSAAFRGTFLPSIAPAVGVTRDNWGEVWLELRDEMMLKDSLDVPLMPAPKEDGQPSLRPVDTAEMGRWLKMLLGLTTDDLNSMDRRLSSHSCKCTCLSYLSKFGTSWDDRAVLGGHCMAHTSVMVYSRDAMSRPLLVLEEMLQKIRDREFFPDSSRSGRFASQINPGQSAMLGRVAFADTLGKDGTCSSSRESGRSNGRVWRFGANIRDCWYSGSEG